MHLDISITGSIIHPFFYWTFTERLFFFFLTEQLLSARRYRQWVGTLLLSSLFLIISESVWLSKGKCVWHKCFNAYEWTTHSGPYLLSATVYMHPWKPHLRGQKVGDTTHILLLYHPVWNLVILITIYCRVPQFKYQVITAYGVLALINLVNNQDTQDICLCGRPVWYLWDQR